MGTMVTQVKIYWEPTNEDEINKFILDMDDDPNRDFKDILFPARDMCVIVYDENPAMLRPPE